ncbi:Gfo/Idh/MocA family protein [Coraliomargarita akajimensis]|uniref:Oxidoreductase domain protein n=1 Tax=Coraliomargarita akajimensis (strain DSM 45221 / IAM 15411 / JCM 23193 / KCTC 12865 / 04OKA010-24) TaxID=583355 RepID=D5EN64_CORAD|nr:Gfo/Idh/MocA family oxidoreductase [Coraliomargarita akajimensis]ADE53499.1 oxidoreductase domain protein [Coraliomargarita akajimensis DSM 45221]
MNINRRQFIRTAGLASAAFPTIISSTALGQNAPSKKITLGFIGVGYQGVQRNLRSFLNEQDCQVVSVCDAYMSRALKAQAMVHETYGNRDCKAVQDFREIINDPSIDAVVISTPDHWHVPMSIMAVEAGKDVFCEKPTLSIHEGRELVDAFTKHNAIFQAGIEDRSSIHFHKMVEWVKNGEIGELERVNVMIPGGMNFAKEAAVEVPEDLDWNLWQGPAAFHDYTPNRTGFWQWRSIDAYSKGAILDMGTHLVDTAQIGINDPDVCPVEVSGTGEIPVDRLTDVPIKFDLNYRYGNGVELHVINGPKGGWDPDGCAIEFIGNKGWIRRKSWSAGIEASDKNILRKRYAEGESKHWKLPPGEHRDFLDGVKARKHPVYPAIDLHHMSTMLHMGVLCIELERGLKWDPKTEQFLNDDEANKRCHRPAARNWEQAS